MSAGGGGDGYPLLRAYADALEVHSPGVSKSVVCLGPDMPPRQRNDLKQRLLPRSGSVFLFDFRPDLVSFLPLASVSVSMGGYNTIAEVVAHQKRAVVVPRVYPRREQWLRARALEDLGLLQTVDPAAFSAETIGEAIRGRLAMPPPALAMDFGGLRRITRRARVLLGLDDAAVVA